MMKKIISAYDSWRRTSLPVTQSEIEWRHAEVKARFEAVNAELAAIRRKLSVNMESAGAHSGLANLIFQGHVSPYRAPNELERPRANPLKALLVGECLSQAFQREINRVSPECQVDFLLFNNHASLPEQPPVADCDFHIVQVPLRSIAPDGAHPNLAFDDVSGHAALFEECRERLLLFLDAALRWNRELGVLTFVSNFMLPQQNPLGRLLPKRDLRNLVHFVDRLNDVIHERVAEASNAYVLDIDEIAATFGRRFFQDDAVFISTHGGYLNDYDHPLDAQRLEPPPAVSEQFHLESEEFYRAWWRELVAMYASLKQTDSVKLVIFDLDDTLWRGVAAEGFVQTFPPAYEGWPIGLAEALCILKKRGVLLAIVSKNDEARIEALWNDVMPSFLPLSAFAVRKINWRPKAENIGEIISAVNVLPRNVVMVDDNPVERAAIAAAFPEIRLLGSNLYCLRRILLWAAETQVPQISLESSMRTQSVKAQVEREADRAGMSHEEFLATLKTRVSLFEVSPSVGPRLTRTLELINKSNQFNTTGKRWSAEETRRFFAKGGRFFAFEVSDKYTNYGLVGVIAVSRPATVEQFVMSCRVMGMGIETAVLSELGQRLAREGAAQLQSLVVETDANGPARDLFERFGMRASGTGAFSIDLDKLPAPAAHVTILAQESVAGAV